MVLYVRNMACDSCMVLVRQVLEDLGIQPERVELGMIELPGLISDEKKQLFARGIAQGNLQLVDSEEEILIDKIKGTISEFVLNKKSIKHNLSGYLEEKIGMDYGHLASYFSGLTGLNIEQYGISLKIEKVKEMLTIENRSLKEIAELLDYKQASHLSNQFKKLTGISPSRFKKDGLARRKSIQELGRVG